MKTYEIKDLLKKELIIVELPKETYFEIFKHGILFKDHLEADRGFIEGSYTLLGAPDEIKEENAEKLVEKDPWVMSFKSYRDYSSKKGVKYNTLITALESFFSALESEIYWENPYGKEPIENLQSSTFGGEKTIIHRNQMNILWNEAESRTFYRNRTLIFVKN